MDAGAPEKTVRYLNQHIIDELKTVYPEMISDSVQTAYGAMSQINEATGNRFIVIIDEWDVLIRDEAGNQAVQDEYIDFLRGMFKGTEPTKFISLAYLTGILPIKKLKTQSALNNFKQYTMLSPGPFAPYIGFTEEEVQDLCIQYHQQFHEVKRWYDGYLMGAYHVYNPNAVVNLMVDGTFQSYWSQTGTYEAILPLINNISVKKVDRAVFPVASIMEKYPVPEPSRLTSDNDQRRIRAISIAVLEQEALNGHTILPRDLLVNKVNELILEPACHVTTDIMKAIQKFNEPLIMEREMKDGTEYYKLVRIHEYDEIIEKRVRKRLSAAPHEINADWRKLFDDYLKIWVCPVRLHRRKSEQEKKNLLV